MESHSATCHPKQVNTPHPEAGTRFTYPGGMEGWVDLGDWIHPRLFTRTQTVTHLSTNPTLHGRESNSPPNHYTPSKPRWWCSCGPLLVFVRPESTWIIFMLKTAFFSFKFIQLTLWVFGSRLLKACHIFRRRATRTCEHPVYFCSPMTASRSADSPSVVAVTTTKPVESKTVSSHIGLHRVPICFLCYNFSICGQINTTFFTYRLLGNITACQNNLYVFIC